MSKELEAFYCILNNDYDSDERYKLAVNNVEQALQRLEFIDKANFSEALKKLKENTEMFDEIAKENDHTYKEDTVIEAYVYHFNNIVIEQALLKAQEPKKYLKWEDLEFKGKEQKTKVILNGSIHLLCYFRNMFGTSICIIDNTDITIRRENRDFFNDLHLELLDNE